MSLSTLSIATDGILGYSGISMAVNGFYVTVEEDVVYLPTTPVAPGFGGSAYSTPLRKRRRIKAKVYIENQMYTSEILTDDFTVKLSDVRVQIDRSKPVPTIRILL